MENNQETHSLLIEIRNVKNEFDGNGIKEVQFPRGRQPSYKIT